MPEISDDLTRLRSYVEETALGGAAQLPPEPKLAEQLQISRGRLRTLLKHLESEGLIWRHVGKGTFLGPRELDPRSPEWLEGISFGDIMDARRVLEPQLAAHAAIRAKPTDIAALDRCIAEMKSAPSYFLWKRLDERLHRLIAEATHNSLLLLLYETLRTQGRSALDTRLQEVLGHETAPAETNRQHEAIVAAIKSGNPDFAEEAMRDHIARVRAELFGRR